jgi:hypothetical protein
VAYAVDERASEAKTPTHHFADSLVAHRRLQRPADEIVMRLRGGVKYFVRCTSMWLEPSDLAFLLCVASGVAQAEQPETEAE